MISKFEMVAKTFKGLENVLAEELKQLGAGNVVAGNRMVSFTGDLAMLYKANIGCRTALRYEPGANIFNRCHCVQ